MSNKNNSFWALFKNGVYRGFGWAIGATLGFAVVSIIMVVILRQAGGIPLIGSFLATIVDSTLQQLVERTPILPQ